jgi:hypothetical protein
MNFIISFTQINFEDYIIIISYVGEPNNQLKFNLLIHYTYKKISIIFIYRNNVGIERFASINLPQKVCFLTVFHSFLSHLNVNHHQSVPLGISFIL